MRILCAFTVGVFVRDNLGKTLTICRDFGIEENDEIEEIESKLNGLGEEVIAEIATEFIESMNQTVNEELPWYYRFVLNSTKQEFNSFINARILSLSITRL